jgi:Fic family protein
MREAVASSRIEGTQATLSEVMDAQAIGGDVDGDIREVVNYMNAMNFGLERLKELPLSKRLVEEIHGKLLQGTRGVERNPGELRRSPNWIGSPDNKPDTAIFVPPPEDEMKVGLSDWEYFVNGDSGDIPPLVACALMHYQFETLHPFLDGNGRLGRLLITFYLICHDHLPAPLLYVSSYFEDHKPEYYDRLQGVRERGEIEEWLIFFLTAVEIQASDAEARSKKLMDVRESFRATLRGDRSRATEVIDLLVQNPFVTTRAVSASLGITVQGATSLLNKLEKLDIIRPRTRVPGRLKRWICPNILEVLDGSGASSSGAQ